MNNRGTGLDLSVLEKRNNQSLSVLEKRNNQSLSVLEKRNNQSLSVLEKKNDISRHCILPLNISKLVGAFKTTSSKKIHELGFKEFKWHRSFYDRIVRNQSELERIRKYIKDNPANWDRDKNNPNL